MNAETPPHEKPDPTPTIWADLRSAGLLSIAATAVLLFIVYAVYMANSSFGSPTLGQYGDSFGALTSLFNAMAFAALVATVVLQSRELRDSRRELAKQAVAQEAWANAAARQIELTKQLEAIRIRPFIKLEWHPHEDIKGAFELRMRNVGLGVAVVQSIELWAGNAMFGTYDSHDSKESDSGWQECIKRAAGEDADGISVDTFKFDDLNRALVPGEIQVLITAAFGGGDELSRDQQREIGRNFHPIIRFLAADGQRFSTDDQFDAYRGKKEFTT